MRGQYRRLAAGAMLVGVGWLLSPNAVPIYDGIGEPDEPYRFVTAPVGASTTAPPTEGSATTAVVDGRAKSGLNVFTIEKGPQFSLYLPPKAMAAPAGVIVVRAVPQGPIDQPSGARIDGNIYLVTLTSASGVVTLTDQAALATLFMRATTAQQPPPVFQYRPAQSQPWQAVKTTRAGNDIYVTPFVGAGQYALAFGPRAASEGTSRAPLLIIGGVVLLVVAVVVVRLRSAESTDLPEPSE